MANNTMPKAEQISFVPSGTVTSGDVQRAIEELNGQIGGAVGKYIPFDVSTTPYQAVSFSVISVDATASDIVILAPTSPQPGDLLIVRKMDATENLVIFSGPLINGAPNLILQTQFATAELVFDGSNWGATSATAADQIPIADPEGLFTGTNVEAALTELGEQVLRAVTQEVYIASEGQTYFNLMNKYQPGINSLQVYINGLKQTVGSDYIETSNDQIQFLEGLHGGDKITLLVGFIPNNSGPVPSLSFLDETKSLTAGQTVITINTQYFVGINNIAVFLNGVRLVNGLDYIESSSTTITLQEAASAGDILYVQVGQFTVTGSPTTSDQIQHTPNSPEPVTNVRDELNKLDSLQVRYLANRPAAEALATAMPDGATIWIDSDAANGGVRTRNTVLGGMLVDGVADTSSAIEKSSPIGAPSLALSGYLDRSRVFAGSADELQNGIDYVGPLERTLEIISGIYEISTSLQLRDGARIKSSSDDFVLLSRTDSIIDMIVADGISGFSIDGILLNGNKSGLSKHNPADRFSGIQLTNCSDFNIGRVRVDETVSGEVQSEGTRSAICLIGCTDFYIESLRGMNNDATFLYTVNCSDGQIGSVISKNSTGSTVSGKDSPRMVYGSLRSYDSGYSSISINGLDNVVDSVLVVRSPVGFSGLNIGHGPAAGAAASDSSGTIVKSARIIDAAGWGVTVRGSEDVALSAYITNSANNGLRVYDGAERVNARVTCIGAGDVGARFDSGNGHRLSGSVQNAALAGVQAQGGSELTVVDLVSNNNNQSGTDYAGGLIATGSGTVVYVDGADLRDTQSSHTQINAMRAASSGIIMIRGDVLTSGHAIPMAEAASGQVLFSGGGVTNAIEKKLGFVTLSAGTTHVVPNANALSIRRINVWPSNATAAALNAYVSSVAAGTGFTLTTTTPAAGGEIFCYEIA